MCTYLNYYYGLEIQCLKCLHLKPTAVISHTEIWLLSVKGILKLKLIKIDRNFQRCSLYFRNGKRHE